MLFLVRLHGLGGLYETGRWDGRGDTVNKVIQNHKTCAKTETERSSFVEVYIINPIKKFYYNLALSKQP